MSNDKNIDLLVSKLKPVKVVKFNLLDVAKVMLAGLMCVFAAIAILGLRTDIDTQMLSAQFVLESFWLIIIGFLSILAAFKLSIPSSNNNFAIKIPILVMSLIAISTIYSFISYSNPLSYLGHGFACVFEILATSILPASVLFYFIRKAAVLKRDLVGFLVLFVGVNFGLLSVQFTCGDSTPLHLLIWHVIPAIGFMFLGIWIAKKILVKI